MLSAIICLIIGFIVGSLHTWILIRKISHQLIIDDIKQALEGYREKFIKSILDWRKYLLSSMQEEEEKINKNNKEGGKIITPYGVIN